MIFVYYGWIDVRDGAFVVVDEVDGADQERKQAFPGGVGTIPIIG